MVWYPTQIMYEKNLEVCVINRVKLNRYDELVENLTVKRNYIKSQSE